MTGFTQTPQIPQIDYIIISLYIILARLCLGAVMTSIQFQREPWNSYVGSLASPSWQFAEELLKTPKEDVDRMWAEVKMKNM